MVRCVGAAAQADVVRLARAAGGVGAGGVVAVGEPDAVEPVVVGAEQRHLDARERVAGLDVLAALEEARALQVGDVAVAVAEHRHVRHAVRRAALVVDRGERDHAAQVVLAARRGPLAVVVDEARDRVAAARVAHQADAREVELADERGAEVVVGVGRHRRLVGGVERVERRGDQDPALVHALALRAVLVVDELVLVERHDRVAPGREVLAEVGVAAVVALERGAVRRRAGVAAAVVAVHEQDHRRAGRPVGRVVDRPAHLHGRRRGRSGQRAAGGVGLLQVDRAHQDRIDGRDRVRPSRQRVRRGGERRGGRDHDQRERQGEDFFKRAGVTSSPCDRFMCASVLARRRPCAARRRDRTFRPVLRFVGPPVER